MPPHSAGDCFGAPNNQPADPLHPHMEKSGISARLVSIPTGSGMTTQPHDHHADVRGEVLALLERMREAANDPKRVCLLTDQMEVLARTHLVPSEPDALLGVRLSKGHARIFERLHRSLGRVVTKQQLMDAMYFDRVGDEPEIKILDVQICKLRPKLVGTGYEIETWHGRGYALQRVA